MCRYIKLSSQLHWYTRNTKYSHSRFFMHHDNMGTLDFIIVQCVCTPHVHTWCSALQLRIAAELLIPLNPLHSSLLPVVIYANKTLSFRRGDCMAYCSVQCAYGVYSVCTCCSLMSFQNAFSLGSLCLLCHQIILQRSPFPALRYGLIFALP